METELRRRRIVLNNLGRITITFSVWSVIKTLLYFWVNPSFFSVSNITLSPEVQRIALIISYVIVAIMVLIDLLLRLYIGLSAVAVSNRRKRRSFYIVIAIAIALSNIIVWFCVILGYVNIRMDYQSSADYYVSSFVDFTSIVLLIELIFNSLRIRRLEKHMEGQTHAA